MNKCHFLKEIGSYLDSQLSESKKIRLEEHLKECRACSQELKQLETLSGKLKQWHLPSLEPSFDSSVKNKIVAWELQGGKVKMKKKTLSILIPSGALAGILVMVFLGKVYLGGGFQSRFITASDELGAKNQYEPYSFDGSSVKASGGKRASRLAYSGGAGVTYEGLSGGSFQKGAKVKEYPPNRDWGGLSRDRSRKLTPGNLDGGFEEGVDSRADIFASNFYELLKLAPQAALSMGVKVSNGAVSAVASPAYAPSEYPPQFAGQDSVIVIQPLLPATGVGEMIIRTADLRLEVENGKETYKKISEICQELGGYLAESNFFRDEQGRESGRITLRIPKDKFLTVLDKLDGLGKVKDSNTASQDVSQDYANLKSQLDAAKIVYDKMLEALKKRQNTIPEAIKLESELTPVLRRIEVLKNQIERLNNLTSFTTITVNFYESEVSAKVLEDTKQLIKKEMLAAKIRATRWFAQNMFFVGSGIGLFVVVVAAIAMLAVWIKQLIKRG